MKKTFKKMAVILMVAVMTISCFAACGDKGNDGEISVWSCSADARSNPEAGQKMLDYIASLSEVPIKWEEGGPEALSLAFNSGDYPDVVLGNHLGSVDVVKYASSGALLALDEYINEEDTPNLYKILQEYPKVKGLITFEDGHIYSLPAINDFKPAAYESRFFINKTWLDKLGLDVPTSLEELYPVLQAFKTKDPNGNGKADEIPMSFYNNAGSAYPEVLLSSWGISAKHGTWDQFLTVNDGEVQFAPVLDEWKSMIKYYNKLYEEGLLDIECLTQLQDNYNAKVASDPSLVGFFWDSANTASNTDEYIAIPALSAEGNTPVLHIHPLGFTGANTNMFEMTTACENPQAVMRWIDKFYSFEVSVQLSNGLVGTTMTIDESGKYIFNEPEDGESQAMMITKNILAGFPGLSKLEWLDNKIEKTENQIKSEETFKLYENYIDDEVWPRPYYSMEDTDKLSQLTTDLFRIVEEKKAKWIIGANDVDAEWDDYKKSLEDNGLAELMKISQKTYDIYMANQK